MPEELSRNQPILRFHVILQHDWPIEQYLPHIGVFFRGKTKSPSFDLSIQLPDKTNNEHLQKPFFKVIRTSLYQTVLNTCPFGRITSSFTCYTVTHLSHFSLLTSLFLEASSKRRILTAILPSSASSKAYDNSTGTVSLENKQTKDT